MRVPTHKERPGSSINIQRLLAEGTFTRTYKYALLLSLADIAIETRRFICIFAGGFLHHVQIVEPDIERKLNEMEQSLNPMPELKALALLSNSDIAAEEFPPVGGYGSLRVITTALRNTALRVLEGLVNRNGSEHYGHVAAWVIANEHIRQTIHGLVGVRRAEGGLEAAVMPKQALAQGEVRCIGATMLADCRKCFEKDAALARRFQPVVLEEPTPEEALKRYEAHHGVKIVAGALRAVIDYAVRYIPDRHLPDKALDLMDETHRPPRRRPRW